MGFVFKAAFGLQHMQSASSMEGFEVHSGIGVGEVAFNVPSSSKGKYQEAYKA